MSRPAVSTALLTLMLAAMSMVGPFTIDTLFPGFPAVQQAFGASQWQMQLTISLYLAGYALGSLFYGPLSDSLGRRPLIMVGLSGFVLASIGCALAPTIEWMLVFRLLQGMAAAGGWVLGRAVIRDCFSDAAAQRMLANVTLIFGLGPALAPIIGGYIFIWSGWQAILWFIVGYGLAVWLLCLWWLPETLADEQRVPFRPSRLFHVYGEMLRHREFLLLALAGGLNFAAIFLYIASAPALVLDLLGLNESQFGWFFVPVVAGMMLGAALTGRLAGRLEPRRTIALAYLIALLAAALNIGYNLSVTSMSAPVAVLPMALLAVAVNLAFPCITLLILDLYPARRGSASSLQAVVSLATNALVAALLAPLVAHSGLSLALASTGLVVLSLLLWSIYAWVHGAGARLAAQRGLP